MKKILPLFILLASCSSKASLDTALLHSENSLIALSGDDLSLLISASITREDRDRLRHYPSTLDKLDKARPLNIQDIKNLTRSGVTDDGIIREIHATRSHFYLTPDDEKELIHAGVSMRVINEMKHTTDSGY